MSRISTWFKEMWPYVIGAIVCGAIIPSIGTSQNESPDLYLIMMLMVLPTCVFTLGCILSLRRQAFSWSIPLVMLISSQLSMTLPFVLLGVQFSSVVGMALLASIPTLFLLMSEVFFLLVRMYGDYEMSWIGYFALVLICLPLASDLLLANSGYFLFATIAMGVSCAAVVVFMYFYKRETSFSLSAWSFMLGLPLLFLYNTNGSVEPLRAVILLLLPTASTFFSTALMRLVDRYRK